MNRFKFFWEKFPSFFTLSRSISLLILLGFVVYASVLLNGFVGDDDLLVTQNVLLHSMNNIPKFFLGSGFYTGGTQLEGQYYRPLTPVVLSLLINSFGTHAFVFHGVQVAFHILNAILILLIFRSFFSKALSYFLAAVFLLHPIQVEAVAYISDMQDVLFTTCGLSALLLIMKYHTKTHWKLLGFVAISLGLCIFFKEIGILFMLFCGVYVSLYRKELFKSYLLVLGGILFVYLPLRISAVGFEVVHDKTFPIMGLSLAERLITIPKVVATYLSTFFFPKDLIFWQQWIVTKVSFASFYLPLFVDIVFFSVILFVGYRSFQNIKTWKIFLLFSIWLVVSLGVHSQLIPLDGTVSERWFYVPMIGLLGVLGIVFTNVHLPKKYMKSIALIVGAGIILSLSLRTVVRNSDWKDGLTLYSHDEKINTDSFSLENSLGFELAKVGRYDESIVHLKRSTELVSTWPINWSNLAAVYGKRGIERRNNQDLDTAKSYFRESIKRGVFFQAYQNLAKILILEHNFKEAQDFLQKSVTKLPDNAVLWLLLSQVEYQMGDQQAAFQAANQAYLLSGNQDIYNWGLYVSQHPSPTENTR